MTRTCTEIAPLIDELVDGTLDEVRARAVRSHMRACGGCTDKYEATQSLVSAAASLQPVDPPAALWDGIAARLDGDEPAERPRWWWWWQAWRRQLALGLGAAALAAGALLFMVSTRHPAPAAPSPSSPVAAAPEPPTPPAKVEDALYEDALRQVEEADADYVRAIDELRALVKVERGHWRPDVAATFDTNLAAIDAAVEREREVARQSPTNLTARDALHASYRREIDFLQEMVVRGEVAE